MGQKVHPLSFRLGTEPQNRYNPISFWSSDWFAEERKSQYSQKIYQDLALRNYLYKLYGQFGFSLPKLIIERKSESIHVQLAVVKSGTSRKITKNSRRLNRNKVALSQYTSIKRRKFQQRQINFLLKEKLLSSQIKLSTLKTRTDKMSKLNVAQTVKSQNLWYLNALQQRNREVIQYFKKKEIQYELLLLSEVRQVIYNYFKFLKKVSNQFAQKDCYQNFFINSGLILNDSNSDKFSTFLNNRYDTNNRNKNIKEVYRYHQNSRILPIYFTILKVPSLLHVFSPIKRSKRLSFRNLLMDIANKKRENQISSSKTNFDQTLSPVSMKTQLIESSKSLSWNKMLHSDEKAILFKENLTAQTLANFISFELAKQHHGRHIIFRGALKGAFTKIWSLYKNYHERNQTSLVLNKIPLGIRIQVKGRWEGRDRTRQVVFKDGRIPLPTVEAPLDYSFVSFTNRYGSSSVKVWIFWEKKPLTSSVQLTSLAQNFYKRRLIFSSLLAKRLKKKKKINYKAY